MADKPEVGFQFGVEGDQSVLATVQALRNELKNLQQQQQSTASNAELVNWLRKRESLIGADLGRMRA
jgi:hypothetical protein